MWMPRTFRLHRNDRKGRRTFANGPEFLPSTPVRGKPVTLLVTLKDGWHIFQCVVHTEGVCFLPASGISKSKIEFMQFWAKLAENF